MRLFVGEKIGRKIVQMQFDVILENDNFTDNLNIFKKKIFSKLLGHELKQLYLYIHSEIISDYLINLRHNLEIELFYYYY